MVFLQYSEKVQPKKIITEQRELKNTRCIHLIVKMCPNFEGEKEAFQDNFGPRLQTIQKTTLTADYILRLTIEFQLALVDKKLLLCVMVVALIVMKNTPSIDMIGNKSDCLDLFE